MTCPRLDLQSMTKTLNMINSGLETKIDFNTSIQLEFPAVTFCNLNPLRLTALEDSASASHLKMFVNKVNIQK